MTHRFFNGPVQNGDFTFAAKPGKAVGIRIAGALNRILGAPAVPHLWNTVRLAGDLRYLQHIETTHASITREDLRHLSSPPSTMRTAAISRSHHRRRQSGCRSGDDDDHQETFPWDPENQRREDSGMFHCGHMVGATSLLPRCGQDTSRTLIARHLIAEREHGASMLDFARIHARKRQPPRHLQNIAASTPVRLILSRTRDYGIDLSPVGLPGLVLDPRVGIHIAVLAAASQVGIDNAVMAITQNAVANIAAYGQLFSDHAGMRVLYALHGHVPYQYIPDLRRTAQASGLSSDAMDLFSEWFLPLFSLKEKSGVKADQLPALLKYFSRTILARSQESDQEAFEKDPPINQGRKH